MGDLAKKIIVGYLVLAVLVSAIVFIYEIFTPGELYPTMGGFSAVFIGGAVPAGIVSVLLIRRGCYLG